MKSVTKHLRWATFYVQSSCTFCKLISRRNEPLHFSTKLKHKMEPSMLRKTSVPDSLQLKTVHYLADPSLTIAHSVIDNV